MDDSASSSARQPMTELSIGAKVALECAHNSLVQAVNLVHDELTSLKAEHAQLQSRYFALEKQHEELQEEYKSQTDNWREFKNWWKKMTEKKKATATQQTPNRSEHPSSPSIANHQTPDVSATLQGRGGKARLSKSEILLLDKVGLDCSAFATPRSSCREPASTSLIKVKSEDGGSGRQAEGGNEWPVKERRVHSDSIRYTGRSVERSHKRQRSTGATSDFSSPSRRPLNEIGNITVSDASDEAETLLSDKLSTKEEFKLRPLKTKGRGRYSTGGISDGSRTINDEFEVDPDRNGNVSFLHKSVVRDKAERKQMHAHDCECCSEYYKAVGEAPLRRYQELRSVTDQHSVEEGQEASVENAEKRRQVHRQQISRHRGYGPPSATPPSYWDVGFPDTQKQEEINRIAREEYSKKRDQIAKDPRFKKRS